MEAERKVGTWKGLSPLSAPPSLVGQEGEGQRENMAGGLRGGDLHSFIKDIYCIGLRTRCNFQFERT